LRESAGPLHIEYRVFAAILLQWLRKTHGYTLLLSTRSKTMASISKRGRTSSRCRFAAKGNANFAAWAPIRAGSIKIVNIALMTARTSGSAGRCQHKRSATFQRNASAAGGGAVAAGGPQDSGDLRM